jgi:hypothetical protein
VPPFIGHLLDTKRSDEPKILILLALPRGERESGKINSLPQGLGKNTPIELQYGSDAVPKPPPDPGTRSPAVSAETSGADRKGTLDGAELHKNSRSPFAAQAGGHVVLAVCSGTRLIGSIVEIGSRHIAWSADDMPIGSYTSRKAAFSAVNDHARNQ